VLRKCVFHLLFLLPKSSFGRGKLKGRRTHFTPPKRRFWKVGQTFQNGFWKHFSTLCSPNRVLTPLKSASKTHSEMFVRPSKIFVWGAYIWNEHFCKRLQDRSAWPPSPRIQNVLSCHSIGVSCPYEHLDESNILCSIGYCRKVLTKSGVGIKPMLSSVLVACCRSQTFVRTSKIFVWGA